MAARNTLRPLRHIQRDGSARENRPVMCYPGPEEVDATSTGSRHASNLNLRILSRGLWAAA